MYKIITNNSLVYEKYLGTELVTGDFRDVLIKVRDYIHQGYSLKIHPLPASIRMMYSPFRSLVISDEKNLNESILVMENAIEKYDITMGIRKPDYKNGDDYKVLDLDLAESAIREIANFEPKRR